MASAFQGCSHGLGFADFEKSKDRVNKYCKEKKDLEEDPFIWLFQYRNADGKEEYWSYDHM
eukprot:6759453-Ditylum_brightwellii.AAC.1